MRWFLLAYLLFSICEANATEFVKLRFGTHDHFDRIVFEFPIPTSFNLEQNLNTVVIHFINGGQIPSLSVVSKRIRSIVGGESSATIVIEPGAEVKAMTIDRRILLDVRSSTVSLHDNLPDVVQFRIRPQSPDVSTNRTSHGSLPEIASRSSIDSVVFPALPAAEPVSKTVVKSTMPPLEIGDTSGRSHDLLVSSPVGDQQHTPETSIPDAVQAVNTVAEGRTYRAPLPFGPDVGAAAFFRAGEVWLVFDKSNLVDVNSLRATPAFATASVQALPTGVLLRLPLQESQTWSLQRGERGWSVVFGSKPQEKFLLPIMRAQRLVFPFQNVGNIVNIPDSLTGQTLQVATIRQADAGVPLAYASPVYNVLPSLTGVVTEPLSDHVEMHATPEGVVIESDAKPWLAPKEYQSGAEATILTRRFDFPAMPIPSLLRRLQSQIADEGVAPAHDRLAARKLAAQTMLALGLGPEAQSMLHLAELDDPRAAHDPDVEGLMGIAALLSNRPDEAEGLLDPELDGTDEILLWRAALDASRDGGSCKAAALFAATKSLILAYPMALRNRLLPLAADTMACGGAVAAVDDLISKLPNDPALALARAKRLEAKGDVGGAVSLYDGLALSPDRLLSARAATRAVELRLASHFISPAQAADELERHFLDWRGDDRERNLRLQVVNLRAEAGQWQAAFSLLKETGTLFPENAGQIRGRTAELVTDLLRSNRAKPVPPLDLVTLARNNLDLSSAELPDELKSVLADQMISLELPAQAEPLLQDMLVKTPSSVDRATLGTRLASVRADLGDCSGADVALNESNFTYLPPALSEQRVLIAAHCRVQQHDVAGAMSVLAGTETTATLDLKAKLLADAGDWRGSEAALTSLVNHVVPATGPLDPKQQDMVLRLAMAEARAKDEEGAQELYKKYGARVTSPRDSVVQLFTHVAIGDPGDTSRSLDNASIAQAIPAGLAAFEN